jgi:ABC-type phosphate transport system auxiliary subunit
MVNDKQREVNEIQRELRKLRLKYDTIKLEGKDDTEIAKAITERAAELIGKLHEIKKPEY